MKLHQFALSLLLFIFLLGVGRSNLCTAAQSEEIHLVRNEKLVQQFIAGKLISEIYKRIGLVVKIEPLPPLRANRLALNGEKDGEVARVERYAGQNPSLIMVKPAYYSVTSMAFSKKKITVQSKDDLKKYRVGVIRGVIRTEILTEGLENVQMASDTNSLFAMLQDDRFDVVLDTSLNGNYVILQNGWSEIKPVGNLETLELYHILTPKKKQLAAKISAMIISLKKSGELEKMTKKFEQDFFQNGANP